MLGLAGETGSILDIYKKYLRDGIDLSANRELLREELGDLMWYAATVATAAGLDLGDIAEANLRRTRDLYATPQNAVACTRCRCWMLATKTTYVQLPVLPTPFGVVSAVGCLEDVCVDPGVGVVVGEACVAVQVDGVAGAG